MFHSDTIESTIELKNFMSSLTSRSDSENVRYIREHFGEFLGLCKKAGLGNNLAFYYFNESHKCKRWIEFDEEDDACRIITFEDDDLKIVNSEAWEACTFLLLLMTIYRHKWFLYLPWSETLDIVHSDPNEDNWTPLMKILGAY